MSDAPTAPWKISRRMFTAGGGAALATTSLAALAGCDLSTEPSGSVDDDGSADTLEAPELTELVEAGDLPPLEERLPTNPLIVEPVERAGEYGGTWRTAIPGPTLASWMTRTVGYDNLMRWNIEFSDVVPNIAANVEVEDDGLAYTFELRENMRWSDGEPFTAEDILFAVNDMMLNEELSPIPPIWLVAGGSPPEVTAPDERTVRFVFDQPNGLFLERIATTSGNALTSQPRHYLSQFHADYVDDIDELTEAEGFSHWPELYLGRYDDRANPDLPTLRAWRVTSGVNDGSRAIVERNPYYWKTDPDGRQLPYIDKVEFEIIGDDQVMLLKANNGELDMHSNQINTLRNKPVLSQNREGGDYDFFDLVPAIMNGMIIALNLCHEDEVLRDIFRNRDFRIGLSYAINREELIQAVAQGQGIPWQCAPREESEFYDEEMATQYTEFDPDLANEHLDRAGYAERDSEGFRLRPDGDRIRFAVDVGPFQDFWVDTLELIKEYWAEVGVDIQINNQDLSLFYERKEANQHDAGVWEGDGGLYDGLLDPRWYMPYSHESIYATPWATWYTSDGNEGQEPVDAARRQIEVYRQLSGTTNREERAALFQEILQIAKEEFWAIGTYLPTQGYGIVKNNFHNVPDSMPWSWIYPAPGPAYPEHYFIDD